MKYVMYFKKASDGELVFEAGSVHEAEFFINNHLYNKNDIKWDKPYMDDEDTDIHLCAIKENGKRIPAYRVDLDQYNNDSDDGYENDEYEDDDEYDEDADADEDCDDFDLPDDDEEPYDEPYLNTCKWEDGCGGCPYYDECALTQTGSWY